MHLPTTVFYASSRGTAVQQSHTQQRSPLSPTLDGQQNHLIVNLSALGIKCTPTTSSISFRSSMAIWLHFIYSVFNRIRAFNEVSLDPFSLLQVLTNSLGQLHQTINNCFLDLFHLLYVLNKNKVPALRLAQGTVKGSLTLHRLIQTHSGLKFFSPHQAYSLYLFHLLWVINANLDLFCLIQLCNKACYLLFSLFQFLNRCHLDLFDPLNNISNLNHFHPFQV